MVKPLTEMEQMINQAALRARSSSISFVSGTSEPKFLKFMIDNRVK